MTFQRFVEGAQRFRSDFFERERDLMEALAQKGQFPSALIIGCSDSRVIPEQITGARPGDLFVSRVIANIVPPADAADAAVGAVLEYAVEHLHVGHIVVLGHDGCGGMQALAAGVDPEREPHIARWLAFARPALERVEGQGLTGDAHLRALVEANVLLQLEHLQSYPAVRRALDADELEIHGWVYDLHTGQVRFYRPDQGWVQGESVA